MMIHPVLLLSVAALALSMQAGRAGPCAPQIDKAQAAVDSKIEATAEAGRSADESAGALLHNEPTPGSIAAAERRLGEGSRVEAARAALARARDADRTDDRNACEQALADVQRAIGP